MIKYDDKDGRRVFVVWMGGNNRFVKNAHPLTHTSKLDGYIGNITSKLYEFRTVLDAVRGRWTR